MPLRISTGSVSSDFSVGAGAEAIFQALEVDSVGWATLRGVQVLVVSEWPRPVDEIQHFRHSADGLAIKSCASAAGSSRMTSEDQASSLLNTA